MVHAQTNEHHLLLVATVNGITELAITQVLQSLTKDWTQAVYGSLESNVFDGCLLAQYQQTTYTHALFVVHYPTDEPDHFMTSDPLSIFSFRPPLSTPSIVVPTSEPSLGMTLPIANPMLPDFATQLTIQGSTPLPTSWWCRRDAKPNWESQQRAFAVIESFIGVYTLELQPHLFETFQRGITHIGLLTVSTHTHWYPPLAKHSISSLHWYMTPTHTATCSVEYHWLN